MGGGRGVGRWGRRVDPCEGGGWRWAEAERYAPPLVGAALPRPVLRKYLLHRHRNRLRKYPLQSVERAGCRGRGEGCWVDVALAATGWACRHRVLHIILWNENETVNYAYKIF